MFLPLILSLVTLTPLLTLAALNGRCTGSKATGQFKTQGICIKTSTCRRYSGTTKNGACPFDDDDVKCCIIDKCGPYPEGNLGGKSHCEWNTDKDSACNVFGIWYDGEYFLWEEGEEKCSMGADREIDRCPGGDNYKCCEIP